MKTWWTRYQPSLWRLALALSFHLCPAKGYPQYKKITGKQVSIIDLSQTEISILNSFGDSDLDVRKKKYADSIYAPYKKLWNGYLGEEGDVIEWLEGIRLSGLENFNKWNDSVDVKVISAKLSMIVEYMEKISGLPARGRWYILFGPAWTDMGGLGNDGTMLIDLAHSNNSSVEK